MSRSNGLVSIVIPAFGGAEFLAEAIDSALAQTHPRVEVLVVNGGSRDGDATEAVAARYGDRVRYFRKENTGVAETLNLGLREMRGEFFSWLRQEDVYLPHKIESQMARIVPGREGVVFYGDLEYIDPQGRVLATRRIPEVRSMRLGLITGYPVYGCTALVPRECFAEVGEFDTSLRCEQDDDMWFRLAARFPFEHVPEILVRTRVHQSHPAPMLATHRADVEAQLNRRIAALGLDEIHDVHRGELSSFYSALAVRMKLRGFDAVARETLALARFHKTSGGPAAQLQYFLAAAACALLTRKAKPSYWLDRVRIARHD